MIKEIEPGDLGWIISMHGLIYTREFRFDPGFEVDIARKAVLLWDKKDGFTKIWVKKVDGENAGSIAISHLDQGVAFLNFVLVLDAYRGRGIAQALMNHAVQYARDNGYKKVCLETYSCLESARKMYAGMGFQLSSPVKQLEKYGQNFDQEFWELKLEENKNNQFVFWGESQSPEIVGRKIMEDIFTRDDFMMYISDHCTAVHYAEVCAGFGAARLAGLINDSDLLTRLSQRYMKVIDEQIVNTANHVDANVYGILPLELYIQTRNETFFKQGIALADGQWVNPLPNGLTRQTRYWVDDIWMVGSLQIQAYRATGNPVYLDRAALAVDDYVERLQQPNGLFFHGENAPFYWGRGNGWAAAGLAELLLELPEDNVHYASILSKYRKMMDALLQYQSADGMWRQLIDVEEAWPETSGTGMFGYAMAVGVREDVLSEAEFGPAYQKAWLSLVNYVNEAGRVTDVCVGTGHSTDKDFYLNRPKVTGDFHGQAPLLWLAYCLLRMQGV